jgi:endonuclease/exonuclease/phosphatase family metal-dependent hydrolase
MNTSPVSILALSLSLALSGCLVATPVPSTGQGPLRLAAWNMEHLAEANGTGCRPRTDADYEALRAYAEALDADVIAVQEVESKAAVERVFDPSLYVVVVEERVASGRGGACRGEDGLTIRDQRTGFAIRKGLAFERQADFVALQLGNADLRSGVDIVVRPQGGEPVRLLSVHLKSGCSSGDRNEACPVLMQQVPVMENWIDRRATEGLRFAVLGDFNRRLALAGDTVWADWDDAQPAAADLSLAAGTRDARCNPRFSDFIDHIVLDRRAAADQVGFEERTYGGEALSDHCAITVTLERR